MENKLVADRWKKVIKEGKQKKKVVITVITSESNSHCQSQWFGHVLFMSGYFDMVIFENSDTIENYKTLCFLAHNYPNIIIKRGKFGVKRTMDKIVANRNMALNYIRQHKEYDYAMMLDSDIFPPSDIIPACLKRGLDMQCGLCFVMPDGVTKKIASNFFPEDIAVNAPNWIQTRTPRLVKVAQNGLGCVMFKASVLRKHRDIKFINKKITKKGKTWHNEDLYFTGRFREKGYDLWLDLQAECKHIMKKRV